MKLVELGEVLYQDEIRTVVRLGETLGGMVGRRRDDAPVAFHDKHLEWGLSADEGDVKRFEKSDLRIERTKNTVVLEAAHGDSVALSEGAVKTILEQW